MKISEVKTVAILGAGTMGQGIAQLAAMAGYRTLLFDIDKSQLVGGLNNIGQNLAKGIERGKVTLTQKETALALIKVIGHTEKLVADFIIEAVVEDLEVKRKLFQQLETVNSPQTILATNTSSIPITKIAQGLKYPERVVGMHFFNPAHIMKLVEVISGAETSNAVLGITTDLAKNMGKLVIMAKDSPGFIVNRVARHFYIESLKILEEGIADEKTIDRLIQSSGFKMGPFRLMDLIGVDTNFAVTQSMFKAFYYDGKFRPSLIQQQKVDAGHYGKKAGKGFYNYGE